ncbi:hypothetical protein MCHIJ_51640 [Mycolicibacterium chitae]|uniref:hypothetical protein n=1 Tax=Mycolicibacterium chitae TaxID=1792 RepID=UPI000F834EFF|nr:hypothetical protein [Mycolicibacterium chitae]MCV7106774.1 hypothetical protein [Mycolicibacterium chitae]BBZ05727.1 hypothetical protein MCHIJ_51640 [Mycolicibacterium chitae]
MGALLENSASASGDGSPATLPRLLRDLHAERQSIHRQQDVLRHWLDGHDPSKPLRISLRANGFGMLLNELDAKQGRHN